MTLDSHAGIVRSPIVGASPPSVPGAPQNLTAGPGAPGEVDVTWDAPISDGGSAITDYETSVDGASYVSVGLVLAWTDGAAGEGVTHAYRVRAVNAIGNGTAAGPEDGTGGIDSGTAPVQAIIFDSDHYGAGFELVLRGTDGSRQRLTFDGASWSSFQAQAIPGTEWICFLRVPYGGPDYHDPPDYTQTSLWCCRADGSQLFQVDTPAGWLFMATPHWSADGRYLAVAVVDPIEGSAIALLTRAQVFATGPVIDYLFAEAGKGVSDGAFLPPACWDSPTDPGFVFCKTDVATKLTGGIYIGDAGAVSLLTAHDGTHHWYDPNCDPTATDINMGTKFGALCDLTGAVDITVDSDPASMLITAGSTLTRLTAPGDVCSHPEFSSDGMFVVTHQFTGLDEARIIRVPIDGSQTVEVLAADAGEYHEYVRPLVTADSDLVINGSLPRYGVVITDTTTGLDVRRTPGILADDAAPALDDDGGGTITVPDQTFTNKRYTGRVTLAAGTAGGRTVFVNCHFDFEDAWSILRNGGSGPCTAINCTFKARPNPQTDDWLIACRAFSDGTYAYDDAFEGGGDDLWCEDTWVGALNSTIGEHVDGLQYGTPGAADPDPAPPTTVYARGGVRFCEFDITDLGIGDANASLMIDAGLWNDPDDPSYTNTQMDGYTVEYSTFRTFGAIAVRLGAFKTGCIVVIRKNRWHDGDGTWNGSTPLQNAGGATLTNCATTWSDNVKALATTVTQPN